MANTESLSGDKAADLQRLRNEYRNCEIVMLSKIAQVDADPWLERMRKIGAEIEALLK